MKLLLVEDSARLRHTLARGLTATGFTVDTAEDGAVAQQFLATYGYDLMVLDLMLPRVDGMTVLRGVVHRRQRPRVLVLSARDQVADRVDALDAGADDYLIKPFAFDELLARLHALSRRPEQVRSPRYAVGDLLLDVRSRQVRVRGRPLHLTPREFALLELLLRHRGRVFSRSEILDHTASGDVTSSERSVEVVVFGLRRKLAEEGHGELVKTRRGAGYLIP